MGDTAHVTPLAAADFFCLGGGGAGGQKLEGLYPPGSAAHASHKTLKNENYKIQHFM